MSLWNLTYVFTYIWSQCVHITSTWEICISFIWVGFFVLMPFFPTKILWPIAENLKVTHTSSTRKMLSTPSPSPSKACALCAAWGYHGKSAVLSTQLPMWSVHCSLTPSSLLCWALKYFWRRSCTCFKGYPTTKSQSGVLDQSISFCLPRQYPWFKAGSVMPSVTSFGKCWAGRAIIQFTGLVFNPFSLNSYSDSQGQPLTIFIQQSWFILWTASSFTQLPPEGKSSPPSLSPTIHHPHSSALLLPPLELALCNSLIQNRGIFNISALFLHLPFPTCPTQAVSKCLESKHCTPCHPSFGVPRTPLLTYAPGM